MIRSWVWLLSSDRSPRAIDAFTHEERAERLYSRVRTIRSHHIRTFLEQEPTWLNREYVCMHAYIHTYIHTYIHNYICVWIDTRLEVGTLRSNQNISSLVISIRFLPALTLVATINSPASAVTRESVSERTNFHQLMVRVMLEYIRIYVYLHIHMYTYV